MRHHDFQAVFQRRFLEGVVLLLVDGLRGYRNLRLHDGREDDADRLAFVKLHGNFHLGLEEFGGRADRFPGNGNLLVGFRVHEGDGIGIRVKEFHVLLLELGFLQPFFRAEAELLERAAYHVAGASVNAARHLALPQVVSGFEHLEDIRTNLQHHSRTEL